MAAYDDLNVKQITIVSVISIVVTAVTVLGVQVMYFAMADYVDTGKVESSAYTRQNEALAQQAAQLESYGVDEDTGNVMVPVSQVMKAMVKESDSKSKPAGDEQAATEPHQTTNS